MKKITFILAGALLASPAAAADLVATQITADNVDRYIQKGPDAAGGVGDWILSNGTLCATISDLNRESELSATGGALTDLGFCDRADDHIVSFNDLLGDAPVRPDKINGYRGDTAAKITVHGNGPGFRTEVVYQVSADDPTRLKITKTYHVTHDVGAMPYLPRVWFNYHSMSPYILSIGQPAKSLGSNLKGFLGRPPTEIADYAVAADLIIATSAADGVPVDQGGSGEAIAYGWRHLSAQRVTADGGREDLPTFALAEPAATVFATFTNGFWVDPGDDGLGLMQVLQMAAMAPDVGDVYIFEEEILIGDRADAAVITDQLGGTAVLSGRVASAKSVVHIADPQGNPVTYVRPGADGRFSVRLDAGDYQLTLRAGGEIRQQKAISLGVDGTDVGAVDLPAPARLMLPRGIGPMRLTILGTESTPDPDLSDGLLDVTVMGASGPKPDPVLSYVFLGGVDSDPLFVDLPPGSYRVLASRGGEFSVEQTTVSLAAGQEQALSIAVPKRQVESPGRLTSDFHTHAAPSIDSILATGDRVRSFIAEGGEILVAAEHETIFDYGPVMDAMDFHGKVIVVNGTEITSEVTTPRNPYSIGHANAFPLTVKPGAWRGGQPMNEGRRWRDVMADLRTDWPDTILQLNHPTKGEKVVIETGGSAQETAGSRGFFLDHMGPVGRQFDPTLPLTDPHNANLIERDPVTGYRDIDFDAVELLNGPWYKSYRMMRQMWISWLKQGEFVVGVANSDSHSKKELVGWPTNYVGLGTDDLAGYSEAAFVKAVRKGRVTGSTGPVLTVGLNGAGPGDHLAAASGRLLIAVDAADWVQDPSGHYDLRVSVNGSMVHEGKIRAGEAQNLDLDFKKDAFVLVEVEGEASDIYRLIAPKHKPLAFTNPIFVDADGDGSWTPPGF